MFRKKGLWMIAFFLFFTSSEIIKAQGLDQARKLSNQSRKLFQEGKYTEALRDAKAALSIGERELPPNNPAIAVLVNNVAEFHKSIGEYSKAEPLFKRAIEISINAKEEGGADHLFTIGYQNNLASLYYEIGDYAKAEPLFKQTSASIERTIGTKNIYFVGTIHNLAKFYHAINNYPKAEKLYRRSLKILNEMPKEDLLSIATISLNFAQMLWLKSSKKESEKSYKRALEIYEKKLEKNHPYIASLLNNFGALYDSMKNYEKSESLLKQAFAIRKNTYGPDHLQIASSYIALGSLYKSLGKYSQSESHLQHVLKIFEKELGPSHPDTVLALNNVAVLKALKGNYSEALTFFERSMMAQEPIIQNIFSISSESQKFQYLNRYREQFLSILSLISRHFSDDQKALRFGLNLVLSRKGIVIDSQTRQQRAITLSFNDQAKDIWEKLTTSRGYLAKLLINKPENLPDQLYITQIANLKNEIEELESQLAATSNLVTMKPEKSTFTADKIINRLNKKSALLEFIKIREANWLRGTRSDSFRYLVFLLTAYSPITLIDLGDAEKLEKEIKIFLKDLTSTSTLEEKINKQILAAERLYALLWKPLKNAIGTVDQIIISPDGILNLVPFGALRNPAKKFLIENHNITYVTSGRDLLRNNTTIKSNVDLLIAAAPDFNRASQKKLTHLWRALGGKADPYGRDRSGSFNMKFEHLEGALQEGNAIFDLLSGENKIILTGVDATEAAVLQIQRPKTLHLATHGFFLDEQKFPLPSDIFMSSDKASLLPETYENPLIRSGLVLAGANNAQNAKDNLDGLLTAFEVTGMDLQGTQLVTLSACETGLGEVKAGEGVFGLRRAFALAGAQNLIMSLWRVKDKITEKQMITFYQLYGQGKDISKAFRQAQLGTIAELKATTKKAFAQPSLWAPFILQTIGVSK